MNDNKNIFGCFVSYPSLMYNATEEQKINAKKKGDLFTSYIFGEKGLCKILKKLNYENYGNDLILILFQFYVNPMMFEIKNIKEIEIYRKKEKSIGIPIIITEENFFNQSEENRYIFLKESIIQKFDLLFKVVKQKRLDTSIEQLKSDLEEILESIK